MGEQLRGEGVGSNIVRRQNCPPGRAATTVPLALIIVVYLALGLLYAVSTPAWQVPDEPAHYNYVRFVAEKGYLPELLPGDYPHEYLEEIKSRRFPPDMSIDPIRYESHQPPLYYLLAVGVYRVALWPLNVPTHLALRVFSLVLGVGALMAGYQVVRAIYPTEPRLALGTIAFAATLPMHIAMTAAINNDVLAECLLNAIIWQVAAMNPTSWRPKRSIALGVLLGLAFLTKMQTYVAFGVVLFALVWDTLDPRHPSCSPDWRKAASHVGLILGAALLVALPWLVRNAGLYGITDPLGMVRHDEVVLGQLTTRQHVARVGWPTLLREFVGTSFRSFWGVFGWMGVPLDQRIYSGLALLSAMVFAGLLINLFRPGKQTDQVPPATKRGLAILAVWALLTMLGYIWYNAAKYVQHQGRYLFPALVPWGLAYTLGLRELFRRRPWGFVALLGSIIVVLLVVGVTGGDIPGFGIALLAAASVLLIVGGELNRRLPGATTALAYVGMAALAVVSLYGYVVPALSP